MQTITKDQLQTQVTIVAVEIKELERTIKNLQAKKRRRTERLLSLMDLCEGQIKIDFDESNTK
jgi:hypothetical protein